MVLAAFLLVSSPAIPASYGGLTAHIACVIDAPAQAGRLRRRNHYRRMRA